MAADKLQELLADARSRPMDAAERVAQRLSFAFGNGALERDSGVTRESVQAAAARLPQRDRRG